MKHSAENFNLTQRTVFGLLARNLFGMPFCPEAGVDWEAVFRESKAQAVGMQVFANCGQISGIPEELRNEIKAYLFKSMLKNAQIHAQHTYMHKLLSEHGIPYVTLKGAASARYYPDPQNRAMGDVDFYVEKADFERALEVFRKDGFEPSDLDHICHIVLRKKGIHMEMHHTPAGVPAGDVGEIIHGYLSDLREESCLTDSKTVTCYCPSDFHHGLVMLMHLQHHLLAEGVGLRHLCDWAVFVNYFQEGDFRGLFHEKLKAVGLWRLARLISLCAVMYLGLPEQEWMQEKAGDKDIARALMQDIMAGGNFGSKDRQRAYEGMFISNRGKEGVHNNRICQGFQALNRITRIKYPLVEKYPVLLPFGWVPAFGGYMIRTHQRNKQGANIHSFSAYQKSAPRIRLYQQIGLYEPEK